MTMRTSRPAVGFRSLSVDDGFCADCRGVLVCGRVGMELERRVVLGDFVRDADFVDIDIIEIMSN
ncbi:hypothetical protein CFB40_25055 [Burkholderia sp. AU31652]|uniref:hypothetical protein n=1 Tax=Burkholderia TaxID=32008 RepID=UPI000B7A0D09|nr:MULTISPECIES: hypothetical protein [Burkholderia]OXI84303.1 hypothetical protein CFB40_25055 [Burkholderia sp. AU31652]